jgi:enamine deaminase RidA (YjgF/YER057c/UK114 family)
MRVELSGATMLFFSGTASVDEQGRTLYRGDFQAQCLRTFRNLTELLVSEKASWHDIIRTTCYLRDIERDYDVFNEVRTLFLSGTGVDPLPASTGIQAHLCRSDLLVEIEAIAMVPRNEA